MRIVMIAPIHPSTHPHPVTPEASSTLTQNTTPPQHNATKQVMHTFELAVEQAGALRGASAEQRRVKEAETYKSVQGGGILTALGKMQAFAHDPAVAALVASGLDLDSAKLARVTAERLSRFSGAALRDELGELLRRAPGGAAAALLTMTDRMQRRCLRELRPDQLVKLVHALDVDQQASVLEMADSAEAGAALASMDPWEAAQPLGELSAETSLFTLVSAPLLFPCRRSPSANLPLSLSGQRTRRCSL